MNQLTRLSAKGQIVIPKTVRDAKHWPPGTTFDVIDRPDGILLQPHPDVRAFRPTTLADLAALPKATGAPHSVDAISGLDAETLAHLLDNPADMPRR